MTDHSTVPAESTANRSDSSDPMVQRVASILLVMTPILLLAGIGVMFTQVPLDAEGVDIVLSRGWLLFWVTISAGFIAFSIGSSVVVRDRLSGQTGQLLGNIPLLQIPLSFTALSVGWFASRAMARRDTSVAVPQDQLALVMDIMEATNDGIGLASGVLFGFVVVALGYALIGEPVRRVVGFLGVLLGFVCLSVNIGLLLAAAATDLYFAGLLTVFIASLWLIPCGWFVYGDVKASQSGRTVDTPSE